MYIPLSKIDENFACAETCDAVRKQKFHWRRNDGGVAELTVGEIISQVTGHINRYLRSVNVGTKASTTIKRYLAFIQQRANGELLTTAQWIRQYITSHPMYESDSVISAELSTDLMRTMRDIMNGDLWPTALYGYDSYLYTPRVEQKTEAGGCCILM